MNEALSAALAARLSAQFAESAQLTLHCLCDGIDFQLSQKGV